MKRYTGKVSLGHMFSENDRYTKLNPNNKGTITDITELPKGMGGKRQIWFLWDSGSRFALIIILIVFLSVAVNMQSSNNSNIVLGQTNNITNQDSGSLLAKAVTINNNDTIINLVQPLYRENFKIIGQKEVIDNKTKVTEEIFSGNGTINGISVTSTGKSLIIPRAADVIYVKGSAELIAAVDDRQTGKAIYTYEAIGNYGVALFDANATGNLSFLSNTVGIYKVDMNKNGINTFTMWKWGND